MPAAITPERYAQGMTYDQYLTFVGSPENLSREANLGPRRDYSTSLREAFEARQLTPDQRAALRWLVAQPNGPAKMLVIAEEWSSDCRRDLPTFGRMAADSGMELRIFTRDGQRFSTAHVPSLEDAPDSNADLMAEFLNHKHGQSWQSIPVCAFYTRELDYLYHYTEYPAIYDKDRLVMDHIRAPRPGETPDETRARADREFGDLVASPMFRIWASAAVDEMISALHRRVELGAV